MLAIPPALLDILGLQRGEIWLVSLDPTSGHEQKARRPVPIASPEAFSRVTKVPVIVPIASGGNFARAEGFAVSLTGPERNNMS